MKQRTVPKKKKGDNHLKSYLDYSDGVLGAQCPCAAQENLYTGMTTAAEKIPLPPWRMCRSKRTTTMYEAQKALCRGTAFPDLDKPFYGGKCGC